MKVLKNILNYEVPLRTELNFPIEGIEFIDINPVLMEQKVFADIIDIFVKEVKIKNVDYIVSPEARGFLFGATTAVKANIPFIPVRKKGKLPPTTIESEIVYNKEYGQDILCLPKLVNKKYSGSKFYIIDDIYATGNTAMSIKEKIESLGGCYVTIDVKQKTGKKVIHPV